MSKATQQYELQIGARTTASWNRTLGMASRSLNGLGANLRALTGGLMANLSFTRIKEFATDAIETYSDFEQEMKNTAAIASATTMEYQQMAEAAREAGRTTTITAEDSAAALGYMSLAGWDVQSSLTGLLPILHLAEATGKDLQTTSDLVTDSMSALGLTVDQLDSYLDKLTMTNNNANTSAEQLMYALVKTGGSARVLGVEMDDLITATGVLANNGLKSSEAGTALNSILKRLGSNSQAKKALDSLGISLYDAENKFIGFRELFTQINAAMPTDANAKNSIMSALGGRFFSQLQYLLDAVSDSTDTSLSTWDKLIGKVENADGALEKMRDTATSSLSAAQKLLESAWADFQIGAVDVFSDDAKDFLNYIAAELPRLSDELEDFEREHHNEIKHFMEFASKAIVDFGEGVIKLGDFILDNGPAIVGVLAAIAGGKIANGLITTGTNLLEIVTTAGGLLPLLSNPIGWIIAGTAAIAGATTAIVTYMEKARVAAADASLAEHFGNIELSASEVEEAVSQLFGTDNIQRAEAFTEQMKKLESYSDQIDSNVSELKKYNWMIESGIEINGADLADYQSNADSLVKNVQDYLSQQEYTLSLSAQLLSGGKSGLDQNSIDFWNAQNQKAAELGAELNNAIVEATADGIIDPEKELPHIVELQNELIEMEQKVKQSRLDAEMDLLSGDISSGSFDDIVTRTGELSAEKVNNLLEAAAYQRSNYTQQYNSGALSKEDYDEAIKKIDTDYAMQSGKLAGESMQALLDNVATRYSKEIDGSLDGVVEQTRHVAENAMTYLEREDFTGMEDELNRISSSMSESAKRNLAGKLELLKPQYDQLRDLEEQYRNAGSEVPQAVIDGIAEYDMLAALSGEGSMWDIIGEYIASDEQNVKAFKAAEDAGVEIPTELSNAIKDSAQIANSGVDNLFNTIDERFRYWQNKKMHYQIPISIDISTESVGNGTGEGKDSIYYGTVKHNALGGIYSSPILTTFAENGPEAAIPINGSLRAKGLWEKTGRLMGMGNTTNSGNISYSPQIIVQGNANRDDIVAAQEIGLRRFKEMYKEMVRQDKRLSFAGV